MFNIAARHPENCPALVLNADFRPLSYYPLSLWSWQMALKAIFLGKAAVISEYDREVHSPSLTLKLPSVIALNRFVKPSTYPAFTRFNLFLRDSFECQYCGIKHDLTFDHVIPRRLQGMTTWENVTAACSPCNLKKGGMTTKESGMYPRIKPYRPTANELMKNGKRFPPNYLHESWRDFLYWDSELEP